MARILIVEDSIDVRQLIRDLLESLDHEVYEAEDGLQGVKVALDVKPDLVIMDLMMPTAAGDRAVTFMRGTPGLTNIPILVVSAHSDVAIISRDVGADGWMSKPIRMDELNKRINELLNKKSEASSTATPPSAN
jgi:DNA-binding response OmpR family regulator